MTFTWPEDWNRTPETERTSGRYQVTENRARNDLVDELQKAGATDIHVEHDTAVSGDPDPGVVVRWKDEHGRGKVIACDRHTNRAANTRAIGLTLRDLRMATTRGAIQADRAYAGLEKLPPPREDADPHEVLGVRPDADPEVIKAAYKAKAKILHPDRGGDRKRFQELQDAREALL